MITFLVTYYAHPELLKACLDSIRKYHPDDKIIVSQQEGDEAVTLPEGVELIKHDMLHSNWSDACKKLMQACTTDIGVFIEHDCLLLKSLTKLVEKLEYNDLVGVEEVIENLRNSPGFANQNFFIINVKKFLDKHGLDGIDIDTSDPRTNTNKNNESAFGITQRSEKIHFIPAVYSGYGHGTYYGDYVHHLWYGSYKKRNVYADGVHPLWYDHECNRLLNDYWDDKICAYQ